MFASGFEITAPCFGFRFRQGGFNQHLGEVAAEANLLGVRNQASHRFAVLQKDKGDVLIVGAVDAIGKIARRLGDGDAGFLHVSDYQII